MSDLMSFTMRPKTFWNSKLFFTHYFLKFKSQPVNWANINISREIVDNFKNSKPASLCMHVCSYISYGSYLANVLVPESIEVLDSLFSRLSLLYGLFGPKSTAFSTHFRCSRSAMVPNESKNNQRNVIKINNNKQNLQPKNWKRGIWFVCKSHHEF